MGSHRPLRRRGRAGVVAALLLVVAGGVGLFFATRPSDGPTNVLWISLDTVRADVLRFDDPEVAPRLTELARRGTVFETAVSGSSWTLPGHAQMFTGCPPVLHGSQMDDLMIDRSMPLAAELFDAAGFFTAGWWTGWYVAGEYGFDRGFDIYETAMTGGLEQDTGYQAAMDAGDFDRARAIFSQRAHSSHADITSPNVVAGAENALTLTDDDEGLFLFTHFFDPHWDYIPPEPWDTRFDPDYQGDYDGRNIYQNKRIWDPTKIPPRQIPDRDLKHIVALYRGEIGWTDQNLGELLDEFEKNGRLDDTLVIVTSDHGEEFFEHGGHGHRHTLYDELIRVPLLIVPPEGRFPDLPETWSGQVSVSDILPTVLEIAGIEIPAGVAGRSLVPILEGGSLPERGAFGSLLNFNPLADGTYEYLFVDSFRKTNEKLLRLSTLQEDGTRAVTKLRYFDLVADPGERSPVEDLDDPNLVRMWGEMEAELGRLRELYNLEPRQSAADRATQITKLFADDLAGLGYADGTSPGIALPWGVQVPPPLEYPTELVPLPGSEQTGADQGAGQ